jgi:hypothetical protein
MKVFNGVFAVLFLGFAALQYNDPDPLVLDLNLYGNGCCLSSSSKKLVL